MTNVASAASSRATYKALLQPLSRFAQGYVPFIGAGGTAQPYLSQWQKMTFFCHCCHRLPRLASCHEEIKKAASRQGPVENHRLSCGAKQSDPRRGWPIPNLCPGSGAVRPGEPGTEGTL